jgi:hypothetical protein
VSFFRGLDGSSSSSSDFAARATPVHEERRRSIRAGQLAVGTLACPHCDAPVAVGPRGIGMSDRVSCPYCQHEGAVREFLSLALPTRPARVVVRVTLPHA